MSTQYPVLNNKPIDQWKVTELKEELKRRNLAVKGLKEELVKRLFEDISTETDAVNEGETPNGFSYDPDVQDISDVAEAEPMTADNSEAVGTKNEETVEDASMVDAVDRVADVSEGVKGKDGDLNNDISLDGPVAATAENTVSVENIEKVAEDNSEVVVSKNDITVADTSMVDADDTTSVVGQGVELEDGDLTGDSLIVENIKNSAEDTPEAIHSKNEKTVEDASMVDVDDRATVVSQGLKVEDGDLKGDASLDGPVPMAAEKAGSVENIEVTEESPEAVESKNEKTVEDAYMVDADDRAGVVGQGVNIEDGDLNVKNIETDNKSDIFEISISCQDLLVDGNREDLKPLIADSALNREPNSNESDNQSAAMQFHTSGQDSAFDDKHEDSMPLGEDATLSMNPNNQVPEVSLDLGFHVKCESVSTNYVSINEKNKLKDNLNANNFHLEIEVLKPDMVQPSSGSIPPVVDDVHMFGDDKGLVKDQVSLEETVAKYATVVEFSKKEDNIDGDSPEKLNLNKGSRDEDVFESNHIESNKSNELGESSKVNKMHAAADETLVHVMAGSFSSDNKNIAAEERVRPTDSAEKRKLEDHEVKTSDISKRQRRWNPEAIKVSQLNSTDTSSSSTPKEGLTISSSSTPKEGLQPILKRSFSRSDSTLSSDSPKERVVPPSRKPATTSLRIDRFLRPFTLKAVQDLLAKTGTVRDFWIDQIKTHCYVTYSSVEEATATRNAVYNLQWPPNGGRLLVAEFVDPHEVKVRAEAPPQASTPISPIPSPNTRSTPSFPKQPPVNLTARPARQQLLPPPPLPPPTPLSNPPIAEERLPPPPPLPLSVPSSVRERLPPPPLSNLPSARERLPPPPLSNLPSARERLPPPPPLSGTPSVREQLPPSPLTDPPSVREQLPPPPPLPQKKQEPAVLTLDDLFKKTRATPRIYYLPLSEEQVAAKLAAQGKTTTV